MSHVFKKLSFLFLLLTSIFTSTPDAFAWPSLLEEDSNDHYRTRRFFASVFTGGATFAADYYLDPHNANRRLVIPVVTFFSSFLSCIPRMNYIDDKETLGLHIPFFSLTGSWCGRTIGSFFGPLGIIIGAGFGASIGSYVGERLSYSFYRHLE
jgi:CDP-diglyceride synthetase